jgi:hypothetical protein
MISVLSYKTHGSPDHGPEAHHHHCRLSEADQQKLAHLAAVGGCNPSEALRRLLRSQPATGTQPAYPYAEQHGEALEHGARLLFRRLWEVQGQKKEEFTADELTEIHRLQFAVEFLQNWAETKRLAATKVWKPASQARVNEIVAATKAKRPPRGPS